MIKLQLNPNQRMLAQFAWVAPLGFVLVGLAVDRLVGLPAVALWSIVAIGPIVLAAHLLRARAVPLAVFRGLVLLTFPIGLVLFPLLLGLIYYGVFTPMGLLFRAIGRDAMGKKIDRSMPTYWHERGAPRPGSSYLKLY